MEAKLLRACRAHAGVVPASLLVAGRTGPATVAAAEALPKGRARARNARVARSPA